jgi:hypothetical protein
MNSKYIKYVEGNPFPLSKVKDRALCLYFRFVTSLHLFMFDSSNDERNIFVPIVDTVTHRLYYILA